MAKREIKTIFALDGETKYKDAIKAINKEQQLLRAELKAATEQFDVSGDAQKKLTAQADSLAKQIELQKKKVAEAQNAVEQATKAYGENSETTKGYKIELANAEVQLAKLQTQLAKTNKELLLQSSKMKETGEAIEKAGEKMKKVGEGMDKVGKGLTVGVTVPLTAAGAGLLKLANDFDDAADTIRIGTGATGEALQGLLDDFDAVIGKVPADMDKAAATIADLNTRLGLTGKPLQALAQQYLELAHITGEDVTTSIKESSEAFRSWNIDASKYGDSLDHLFKVSQSTGIKVTELAQKVAAATPPARQLGFTYEETANMVGYFEKNGLDATQMMAGLQRAIVNNTKDGEKLAAQFEKESKKLADLKKKYEEVVKQKGANSEAAKKLAKDIEAQTKATTNAEKELQKQVSLSKDTLNQLIERIKNTTNQQEAMNLATETFGARAGVLFVDAIKSGKFNLDEFNRSIASSTETINAAASDTYDYAEQWKMLTNQLAKDLRPVAEKIFNAINDATPVLKSAAEWVGNLAERFAELTPQQQETILKMAALAAAAGPVLSVTSKLTTTIGGLTEGIGKFITKLAEKKAAEEAAKLATEGMTGAVATQTSILGPAALAVGALTLAAIGLNAAYQEGIRPAKEAGEAAESFAKGIVNWHEGVERATSALQGFNMETIISRDKMSELEEGIRTAQENIVAIAERAAAESRQYTEEERKQIEELVGLISDYTAKKIEAYQQQAQVVAAMATQERDITIERANELVKAAEEAKEQTLAIAQAKYTEQVAEAEKLYGHLGELDKKRYNEMVANAEKEYRQQTQAANKTYGDTLSIIQQKYIDQNKEAQNHLRRISEITEELNSLETRKSEWLIQKTEERKRQLKTETLSTQEQAILRAAAEKWATDEQKRLLEELKAAYKGAEESNAQSWIGMVADAELYGGEIAKETQNLATGFIDNIKHLPKKSKEVMTDTMEGMTKEMERKEPSLFRKASQIANGILNSLKRAFDIRSPSHKMQEITEQLFAGADKPIQEAARELPESMARIADNVLSQASRLADAQAYLTGRISASGLKGRIHSLHTNVNNDITGATIMPITSQRATPDIDYKQLALAVEEGVYSAMRELPSQQPVLEMDGDRVGRIVLRHIIRERQRLGLSEI